MTTATAEVKMEVKRDPETFLYTVGMIPRPGVNQVINLYLPPSQFFTDEGREAGKARHAWYDFIAQGNEPDSAPDPRIADEIAMFREWIAHVKPERLGGETPFCDPLLHVCGTPDWFGIVNKRLAIVDFKPKNRAARTRLQTAAYKHMLRQNGVKILDRYELRLDKKNKRFEKHEDEGDLARWTAIVYGYHAATHYKEK
jgi:hypothetical protein